MSGHTRELLLNCFWVAILQNVVVIAEHLISLNITNPTQNGALLLLLLSFLLAFCFVSQLSHCKQFSKGPEHYHEEIDVIMVIWVFGVVHAEGSVNMTIQDVIEFLEGLI